MNKEKTIIVDGISMTLEDHEKRFGFVPELEKEKDISTESATEIDMLKAKVEVLEKTISETGSATMKAAFTKNLAAVMPVEMSDSKEVQGDEASV